MSKSHSMMDIGEGSKKQRQSLKSDLAAGVTGVIEKYAPGTIMPEVPVTDQTKADVYSPEDQARGLGLARDGVFTKALPAMKYTPQMEKLMRMGIRQQLQNAYPSRTISEEDVENAFVLRKEIMIRDFDQWAMTAFDLKQPGVAKMLEEYYPELLERITNMIEQDIEITRFDKYQKVFFPMNYDDLVMKWARERGWIKTMEEIEKSNLLGAAGRYGVDTAGGQGLRAGYTPDLSPMFNAQTAELSSSNNLPYGRRDVDFSKGNPFGAMLMDSHGTRGPAQSTAPVYADQNAMPSVVNPRVLGEAGGMYNDPAALRGIGQNQGQGRVSGLDPIEQGGIRDTIQRWVTGTYAAQNTAMRRTLLRESAATAEAARLMARRAQQ